MGRLVFRFKEEIRTASLEAYIVDEILPTDDRFRAEYQRISAECFEILGHKRKGNASPVLRGVESLSKGVRVFKAGAQVQSRSDRRACHAAASEVGSGG